MTEPTPRTDAVQIDMEQSTNPIEYQAHQYRDLARQLERELAQAQARVKELEKDAAKYRAICRATISHVDGRDLLAELHPEAWHFCDIRVRINGRWREFEGDWLKRLLKARDTDPTDPDTLALQGVEAGNMLVSMQGPPELLSGKPHK